MRQLHHRGPVRNADEQTPGILTPCKPRPYTHGRAVPYSCRSAGPGAIPPRKNDHPAEKTHNIWLREFHTAVPDGQWFLGYACSFPPPPLRAGAPDGLPPPGSVGRATDGSVRGRPAIPGGRTPAPAGIWGGSKGTGIDQEPLPCRRVCEILRLEKI